MGLVRDITIIIAGQLPDNYMDKDYKIVLEKLQIICAEHDLNLYEY